MSKMYTKAAIQMTFNVETCHDRVQPACKWRCFKPTRIHVHVQGWIYMYGADPAYTPLKSPKLSFSGRNNMSYRGKNNCGALNNRFLGYISCGQRVFCFCFCCQKIWKPTHPQPNILDMCLMLLCNTTPRESYFISFARALKLRTCKGMGEIAIHVLLFFSNNANVLVGL